MTILDEVAVVVKIASDRPDLAGIELPIAAFYFISPDRFIDAIVGHHISYSSFRTAYGDDYCCSLLHQFSGDELNFCDLLHRQISRTPWTVPPDTNTSVNRAS